MNLKEMYDATYIIRVPVQHTLKLLTTLVALKGKMFSAGEIMFYNKIILL